MSQENFRKIIDSARQILVGKLPNPQDQIDAITYAMMYKFMNDIDDRSASLPGGKRTYFSNDYEKYSWHNLMRADGQDQLILYRDAIEKMSKNPGLPLLFREIFNGSMLKFNDPRTLRLFLKEMDLFTHATGDHIGDAYEYLLSLMGSQGGLGQFRTPRHIIKFIVDAVDPDKNDKIMDPAAGTAGFLISAYEHILHKYDGIDDDGTKNDEKRLSSAELDKIHNNFRGFDIDATMIRTGRVNLYLHGFKTPDIIEHDTLTSEDYWSDRYDVILANPPFMTPKGGIQPHKKFGVSANRAEVLFVDYIASHLKPKGRAGIIVPEGIIFQGGTAYKQLRKNLIENSIYAVVSLPSGVFLPYAGVKTDILLLDTDLAKGRDSILFVNITNDGFSLSQTRSIIAGEQLTVALKDIEKFKNGDTELFELSFTIPRSKIMKDKDFNLSGDRYREASQIDSAYELIPIGELVTEHSERVKDDKSIPVWSVSNKDGFVNPDTQFSKRIASEDTKNYKIIRKSYFAYNPSRINVGSIALNYADATGSVSPMYVVFSADETKIRPDYLFKLIKSDIVGKEIVRLSQGAVRAQLKFSDLSLIKIPLPPLTIQDSLMREIQNKQHAIDSAREVIASLERERDDILTHALSLQNTTGQP